MTTTLVRRAGLLALGAAATTALTGCAGVLGAKMTYDDTEKTKITAIKVTGGTGDIYVKTAAVTETTIKRVVRRSSNPGESYRLQGSTLTLDTSCGRDCDVSYEIVAPAGVTLDGELRSGDVHLTGVGATDLRVTSGDIRVDDASGPVELQATSGDIRVLDAASTVKVKSTSGDVQAINAAGAVDLEVTSGDITAKLANPASVRVRAHSGDVEVIVPPGKYKVNADTGSGDNTVTGVTNDSTAKNTLDVETTSGDVRLTAAA
jgi:hypothetical protein